MADLLLIVSIALGLYLAWNIGVSTFGSTIGITFGSTKIPRQTAAVFSSIAAILGIALLSNRVVDTISKDLVRLDLNGLFSVLIAIAIIATIVVYRGIPISTTYVVIGAISGHALIKSAAVNFATLEKVAISM